MKKILILLKEKRGKCRRHLKQNILSIIFQRLYFSFESSGLGYPCLNVEDTVINEEINKIFGENSNVSIEVTKEICNSFIRILGDIRRYDSKDRKYAVKRYDSLNNLSKKVKNYLEECSKINGFDKDKLKKLIWKLVCNLEDSHRGGKLEADKLFIKNF